MAYAAVGDGEDVILVEADPGPFRLDPRRTAVVVVDMQNDFGSVGGMFERSGIDISMIRQAVPPISAVLHEARQAGMPVIFLVMQYQPDLSDAGAPDSPNRLKHRGLGGIGATVSRTDGQEGRILVEGTWNTAIVDELAPHPEDIVLSKTRFSGFYGTRLDETLRGLGITHLVVTGCTTSVCVDSTVRDAFYRDYSCLLLSDCMGEPIGNDLARSNHDATLLVLEMLFAWVSDSSRFRSAIQKRSEAISSQAHGQLGS